MANKYVLNATSEQSSIPDAVSSTGKETPKMMSWCPLTKWHEYFLYPTKGAMRNICARRKENGADAFLSIINGRFYVNIVEFHNWMSKQNTFIRSNYEKK